MDHSQHSIPNHDAHAGHHMGATLSPTTGTPVDVMTLEDHNSHGGMQHGSHGGMGGSNMDDMHGMHGPSASGHDAGMMMMNHMMSMAFHFGYNETILFSWWTIESVMGLLISCGVIFIMAILYEGLKYYREYLFWKTYNLLEYRPVTGPQRNPENPQSSTTATASPMQYVGEVIHKQPPSMLSLNHVYQTLLHVFQVTLSFLLMLIFMTFNVWLCVSVVLGAAVGYFLFCWKKSVIVDVTEHCH